MLIITVLPIISKFTELSILVLVLVLRMLSMKFIFMSRIRQTKSLNTNVNICSTKSHVGQREIKINYKKKNLCQYSYEHSRNNVKYVIKIHVNPRIIQLLLTILIII